MKCRLCKRNIPDNSLYCNWCGKYQLKSQEEVKVPKPRQFKSGAWNIWLEKEKLSITESTPEKCTAAAKRERKKWLADEAAGLHEPPPAVVTLRDVLTQYLEAKKMSISASTYSGYKSMSEVRFQDYMDEDVSLIDWQEAVNRELKLAKPKTVKNMWSLCSSAMKFADIPFKVPSFPRSVPAERNWLDYKQIETFVNLIEGQPCELVALLALHSLRRSEIFGLRPSDYDSDSQTIHIRGAMVSTIQAGWVRSDLNKNDTSRRDVPVIIPRLATLLDAVDKSKPYIIGNTQKNAYREINAICKAGGLPQPGLHGLRHSFASLAYHLGWKQKSTQQIGGWKNSKVLDEIYTHNADLEADLKAMRDYYRSENDQK